MQTLIFFQFLTLFKELHASKEVKENALASEGNLPDLEQNHRK